MNKYLNKTKQPDQQAGKELNKGKVLEDNRPKSMVQRKANNTGLPSNLKSGIESLSGYAMDDVKVHYNSSKPAQLNAHAYAQGTDIHLASGQEKHLPHEAWHVVQQKQGRVQPTKQLRSKVNINDDEILEKEADVMGAKALQMKGEPDAVRSGSRNITVNTVQRKVGFEIDVESHGFTSKRGGFLKEDGVTDWDFKKDLLKLPAYGITIQFDAGTIELILPAVDVPGGAGKLEKLFKGIGLIFEVLGEIDDAVPFIDRRDKETDEVRIVQKPTDKFEGHEGSGDGSTLEEIGVKRKAAAKEKPVYGDLQATVGVKFAGIGALADVLTDEVAGEKLGFEALKSESESYDPHYWDPKETYGNKRQKDYLSEASKRVLEWSATTGVPYQEISPLLGFLTIIVSYLITSKKSEGIMLQDAKGIAPLMSRVSLNEVWQPFMEKYGGEITPGLVLKIAGVGDGRLYQEDGLPSCYKDVDGIDITREAWLADILSGKTDVLGTLGDSMSEVTSKRVDDRRTTEDFGMKSAVDVGNDDQGMILEIRRLPRHLNYVGLKSLAFKIYKLVEAANKL